MSGNNFIEAIDKSNLNEQTKSGLNKVIKIGNYFYQEISQKRFYSKKLNKYITTFNYINQILIILSATSGAVSIISFTSITGVPAGILSASFTLAFSLATGIIKKLLSTIRMKKKKHDKILMLAKSKLNDIETLISQALDNMGISLEEFIIILKEKAKYERMKYIIECENDQKNYEIE